MGSDTLKTEIEEAYARGRSNAAEGMRAAEALLTKHGPSPDVWMLHYFMSRKLDLPLEKCLESLSAAHLNAPDYPTPLLELGIWAFVFEQDNERAKEYMLKAAARSYKTLCTSMIALIRVFAELYDHGQMKACEAFARFLVKAAPGSVVDPVEVQTLDLQLAEAIDYAVPFFHDYSNE